MNENVSHSKTKLNSMEVKNWFSAATSITGKIKVKFVMRYESLYTRCVLCCSESLLFGYASHLAQIYRTDGMELMILWSKIMLFEMLWTLIGGLMVMF